MAKKKPQKTQKGKPVNQTPVKQPRGRARERGDDVPTGVDLPRRIHAALKRCSEHEDRKMTAIVRRALERYLQEAGFLDKPAEDQSQP